ncbi:MAG: cytidylyltransferase domain-containing protein [bacterium]
MINSKKILAIIPARGGSKRLSRKNILNLAGKPLICWTIEAALNSKYIDKLIVSSEDEEILEIAKKSGAEILVRPKELATDEAKIIDVVFHVLKNIEENFDIIILLQPTSPLRESKHIDEALNLLIKKDANAIVSVCEAEHNPLWCNTLPEDGSMKNFLRKDIINRRSQDLEKYYRLNGAIYICKTEKLLVEQSFFLEDNIYAYIMDRKSSVDIDDEVDFKLAEILIKAKYDGFSL